MHSLSILNLSFLKWYTKKYMKSHSGKILGIFASLTLFLALQPAFIVATFIDTSDDADSGTTAIESRVNTFLSKRISERELFPQKFDGGVLSQKSFPLPQLYATTLFILPQSREQESPLALNIIRGPPCTSYCS